MLPDLLKPSLNVVICGTGAGAHSAAVGHYYAGLGNRFWRTLADVGLTAELLTPDRFERLLEFGIGLTDLVKTASGSDRDLSFGHVDRMLLHSKLIRYQPKYLCFNGKRAAQEFLSSSDVAFGIQPKRFGRTVVFVAPSTSAAANASWDQTVWADLARRIRRLSDQR